MTSTVPQEEWDASAYDTVALPHVRWGRATLDRLDPDGVDTVIDAGCGTGRETARLLELLPTARVISVDCSHAMLARLRLRLGGHMRRVHVVCADLRRPLPIRQPVDAITSVATFHWISDHGALFRALANVLRPGGQLVAECGGRGNIARIDAIVHEILPGAVGLGTFEGPDETQRRLREAGFTAIEVELTPDSERFTPSQLRTYLASVVLRPYFHRVALADRDGLARSVAERLGEPVVDYVRLKIRARRVG